MQNKMSEFGKKVFFIHLTDLHKQRVPYASRKSKFAWVHNQPKVKTKTKKTFQKPEKPSYYLIGAIGIEPMTHGI